MSQGRALLLTGEGSWALRLTQRPLLHLALPTAGLRPAARSSPPSSAQPEKSSAASLSFCLPPPTGGMPVSGTQLRGGWVNHRGETLGDLFAHTQRLGCTGLPSKIHGLPAKPLNFLLEKLMSVLGCPVTASSLLLPPGLFSHHQKDLRPGRDSEGSLASGC